MVVAVLVVIVVVDIPDDVPVVWSTDGPVLLELVPALSLDQSKSSAVLCVNPHILLSNVHLGRVGWSGLATVGLHSPSVSVMSSIAMSPRLANELDLDASMVT